MGAVRWFCHDRGDVRRLPANAVHLFSVLRIPLQNEYSSEETLERSALDVRDEFSQIRSGMEESCEQSAGATMSVWKGVTKIAFFFVMLVAVFYALNAAITSGLRRVKTSAYGASNQIMQGKVNAQIVITGSSRALAHYDPRAIEAITGRTAYNLGRNGSQTDMQVAFLKAYLAHNQKPEVVVHNLDAFSFVTTHEVYDPVEYTPYLYDHNLYDALHKINPNIWKTRYIPLYGYVVEDMKFAWILGLKGFVGLSPREDYFQGFNPRSKQWSDDFQKLRASNPDGVSFDIEPGGIEDVKELIRVCQENGIRLIFVYSPEYSEMQELTNNRAQIFGKFRELILPANITFWDYSNWPHADDKGYFQNSQHLNAEGAAVFSDDLANQLKGYFTEQNRVAEGHVLNVQADHHDLGN
jgi:hypothetical protein